MKVIISVNGVSKEIDAKDLKSANDVRNKVMEVAKEAKESGLPDNDNVTTILEQADAFETAFEAMKINRKNAIDNFADAYDKYNTFLKENNLLGKNQNDLNKDQQAFYSIHISNLAMKWHKLGEFEGVQAAVKSEGSFFKQFSKYLEQEYKKMFPKSKRKQ